MKNLTYIIGILLTMISCETKEPQPIDIPLEDETVTDVVSKPEMQFSTKARTDWESYYDDNADAFDASKFTKAEKAKINRTESAVEPIWSKEFQPIYKDFLIYNPDSTIYLDMDSYKWYVDDQGELHVGADQALVLVNIPKKTAETLLIYGPSFWIEDAYFKNDSTIVVLENSSDKIPSYQEINLNTDSTQYYDYKTALDFESNYLKDRINRLYKNPM